MNIFKLILLLAGIVVVGAGMIALLRASQALKNLSSNK